MDLSTSITSTTNSNHIIRAYLCKKGHIVKNWKLRLFVLKFGSNFIEYFIDETKETINQPQGRISLYQSKVEECTTKLREYCFKIETSQGKSWIISASSKQQQQQWIASIQEATFRAEVSDDAKHLHHKSIEKSIQNDIKARNKTPVLKLLLLGTGESGKSTIVKQMKILHNKGFSNDEKDYYKLLIYRNLLDGFSLICKASQQQPQLNQTTIELINSFNQLYQQYDKSTTNLNEIINLIVQIWLDENVNSVQVLNRASQYHLNESTCYYLNEIKRISKPGYTPSSLDILKSRSTTNGVVETDFKIAEVVFRIVDVAGQRGERKKWISFFDDITAIIFVAAISEYDQLLVEDNFTNRLHESLGLFDQVCNDPIFPKSSIILFLNKIDIFREKIKRIGIQTCFPDYKDDSTYEKTSNYIKNNFLSKKKNNDHQKHIYYHFTCATDTKSFETVFMSVQDIIISKILDQYT